MLTFKLHIFFPVCSIESINCVQVIVCMILSSQFWNQKTSKLVPDMLNVDPIYRQRNILCKVIIIISWVTNYSLILARNFIVNS